MVILTMSGVAEALVVRGTVHIYAEMPTPLQGVNVALIEFDPAESNVTSLTQTRTDAEGRYQFDNVEPGNYRVRLGAANSFKIKGLPNDHYLPRYSDVIRLTETSKPAIVNFVVRRGITVRGTVLDHDHTPVADCRITAPKTHGMQLWKTDDQGQFKIRALPPQTSSELRLLKHPPLVRLAHIKRQAANPGAVVDLGQIIIPKQPQDRTLQIITPNAPDRPARFELRSTDHTLAIAYIAGHNGKGVKIPAGRYAIYHRSYSPELDPLATVTIPKAPENPVRIELNVPKPVDRQPQIPTEVTDARTQRRLRAEHWKLYQQLTDSQRRAMPNPPADLSVNQQIQWQIDWMQNHSR